MIDFQPEQRIHNPLLLSFDCVRDGGEGAAAVGHQMETRARHQSRQAFHELQRLHDDMGGAVFVRTLQLQPTWPARLQVSRSLAMAGRVM